MQGITNGDSGPLDHDSLIFPFCDIVQCSMELQHRASHCVPTSIVIPKTQLTSVMSYPLSVSRVRRRCTSYAA
jgi:hypothetical protein